MVGDIVTGIYDPADVNSVYEIDAALRRYAALLTPWARAVGMRMISEVDARDRKAWQEVSKEMAGKIRRDIHETDVGHIAQIRLAEQVSLITSLPVDAAERVHKLTLEGMENATRAKQIADEIMKSGHVTRSRAMCIARTETSRTQTEFQRARAESAGSTKFIWRTAHDGDVRDSHKKLDGKVFEWNNPPECDPGYHALPGGIFNCRCRAEPLFDFWDD